MIGRFGIIGNPLNHSISPLLFEGIFKLLNLDYVYIPFTIKSKELNSFLQSLKIKGFDGMNVTIPYKESICPLLDELDEHAKKIKAVNTIKFENGKIIGFNTDFYGFYKSIEEFKERIKIALILGGGGAGRAVLYALSDIDCEEIIIIERNPERREKIMEDFFYLKNIYLMDWRDEIFHRGIEKADFIINATPLGMKGFPPFPFKPNASLKGKVFYDLIYNPSKTSFLSSAQSLGAEIKNGLEMLIYQAMKSFEIWTGKETKKEDWEKIYSTLINKEIKEEIPCSDI